MAVEWRDEPSTKRLQSLRIFRTSQRRLLKFSATAGRLTAEDGPHFFE